MGLVFSIIAVVAIMLLGWLGGTVDGLHPLFGVIIPYIAIAVFFIGLIVRIVRWARAPVPFRITTTCGQQKSLDFIKQNKLDNPYTGFQTFLRMALEVLTFRSLFRNTKAGLKEGPKLTYGADKWLWLFSLVFHYSFLMIILRHFRFFTEPTPSFVLFLQEIDGFFQVGLPIIYITSIAIVVGVGFLFFRRIFNDKMRYISLASDYFPLLLILGIAGTGIWMRHIDKVDLLGIKELSAGLLSFQPVIPADIEPLFFIHLFLVSVLLIYFPMSKLVHMPGIFLSPTRNLANNNRAERHVNPWNEELNLPVHTYEEYEEEFRDVMKAAGLPLEKDKEDKDG